jgi:hypothetical protein
LKLPTSEDILMDFAAIFNKYAASFSETGRREIEHYLTHDEHELAFEGFILELLSVAAVSSEDRQACLVLGKRLGLDKATVFDPDTWEKLQSFATAAP